MSSEGPTQSCCPEGGPPPDGPESRTDAAADRQRGVGWNPRSPPIPGDNEEPQPGLSLLGCQQPGRRDSRHTGRLSKLPVSDDGAPCQEPQHDPWASLRCGPLPRGPRASGSPAQGHLDSESPSPSRTGTATCHPEAVGTPDVSGGQGVGRAHPGLPGDRGVSLRRPPRYTAGPGGSRAEARLRRPPPQ